MAERLVNVDRDTPMLLPVDMRDWVPDNDLVHFVINAVDTMNLSAVSVNSRGSGSKQYPPRMMLALVIYSYANGVFGSRRIERSTYRDVAVRYLTGDTHPDHDTICTFRRENGPVIKQAFVEVLRVAREMKLLKVGTVSVDGTHIRANASKHKSLRYDRAGELERMLEKDVEELLARAEKSDSDPSPDDQSLPQEIARRERLLEKMREARRILEERARSADKNKEGGGEGQGGSGTAAGGGDSTPTVPEDSQQINLTDPDSALMRKSRHDSYEQAYNAQAVVDAEGSQMVLATDVIRTPSDANQLEPALEGVTEAVGPVQRILADGGYVNAAALDRVQKKVDLYVAIASEDNNYRRYDYRPPKQKPAKRVIDPRLVAMREKLATEEGKRIYGRRASSVEPAFGIIKSAMGLRQFLLRGLAKVRIEWDLACLAYNMRRFWSLTTA
jgi:transposase